jgi:hypothetical protein
MAVLFYSLVAREHAQYMAHALLSLFPLSVDRRTVTEATERSQSMPLPVHINEIFTTGTSIIAINAYSPIP